MEMALIGLLVCSTLTGLTTEAIKKILDEHGRAYHANTLAGIVALIISAMVGIGYCLVTSTEFTVSVTATIVCLVFLSWLCAMVGYDKVIQTIKQLSE